MPGIDFALLRQQIRLGEVLELAGFVATSRLGRQVRGPCPLHGSHSRRSRSFAAHLERQVWHCFGCQAGGNVLDFWAAWTRQPLHAAAVDLCQRLAIVVPWQQGARPGRPRSPPRS
jgi:DNA primase